jgi:carotenoid 1,2-hydratase
VSDCGRFGFTVIAFIGSVFSPYYAAARRRGVADPHDHVAFNVALYGLGGPGWAMTERNRGALSRGPDRIGIGRSALALGPEGLRIDIDEWTNPIPRRLRGCVRLVPAHRFDRRFALDALGRHAWTPLAPCARVEVCFDAPDWRWSGCGYFDSNEGEAPLEADFAHWAWSRATLRDGSAVVLYDADRSDGTRLCLARRFGPDGSSEARPMPPRRNLPRGVWLMPRTTHGDGPARLVRSLEDAPFYTRSLVETSLDGERVTAMHESLSLDRFRRRWVQYLLPYRMPR